MTARTLASPVQELARLRAENLGLTAELAAVTAERDQLRAALAEQYDAIAAGDEHAHCRDMLTSAYEDRHQPVMPFDVDEPAPFPNKLDRKRIRELDKQHWPPHGRTRFGDPRPGDYMGGPVPTW